MSTHDDRPAPNRNAVRHGLAAEFPQSKHEADRLRILKATFTARLRPADEVEKALIARAASAVIRLERCEDAERAVEGPNFAAALRDWERDRRHAVRRRAQSLGEDPAGTVAVLEQSAFGCDWLLRKWGQLRTFVADRRGWTTEATRLALQLLGHRPNHVPTDDPDAAAVLAGGRAFLIGEVDESAPVILALAALIDRAIARLEPLRDAGWEAIDRPERNAVLANARIDTSPSGRLRHRYAQDAERTIGRSIDLLVKFRKAEQAAAALPIRTFGPAPAARPADPPAAGAPAAAPPSRIEPESASREAAAARHIPNTTAELHAEDHVQPISILRRTDAAADGARSRPRAPDGHRDRPRPSPAVLRAGEARPLKASGPLIPDLPDESKS